MIWATWLVIVAIALVVDVGIGIILKWMEVAKGNGELFYEKGNQSAAMRARKALDQIAKLKVQWRKEMMAAKHLPVNDTQAVPTPTNSW